MFDSFIFFIHLLIHSFTCSFIQYSFDSLAAGMQHQRLVAQTQHQCLNKLVAGSVLHATFSFRLHVVNFIFEFEVALFFCCNKQNNKPHNLHAIALFDTKKNFQFS